MLSPLLAGCSGSSTKGQLPTLAVSGVVKIDGQPSGRAMLQLTPQSTDGKAPGASGMVDDNGKFTLQTYAPGDGIPAGTYTVGLAPDYGKFKPVPAVDPLTVQIDKSKPDLELNFKPTGKGPVGLPPPGMERRG
jgi:hypothetical protein